MLPAKIVLNPETAELGISVANVALAESSESLAAAFSGLEEALRHSREIQKDVEAKLETITSMFDGASGRDLQEMMHILGQREADSARTLEQLCSLLSQDKFQKTLMRAPDSFNAGRIFSLLDRWRNVHIPSIRHARLSAVMLVFRRARERGVKGAELDAEFAKHFLAAPREEADSWQETAHLLAVPESADRLLRSIRMASQDRTDQIPGSTG